MAINIQNETLLTLSEAARTLPRFNGKNVHSSTLWRWATVGLQGVRLDHVLVGRRMCTSLKALSRFMNALAEARQSVSGDSEAPEPSEDQKSRLKAADDARASLESSGF